MTVRFDARPRALVVPPETRTHTAAVVRPSAALVLRKDAGRAVRGRFCVFSTYGPDRMRDTISQSGWHLDAFRKNPVVLLAHNHSGEPIARIPDVHVDPRGLVGTLEPPPRGLSPVADRVFDLWDAGFLNATSVGFRPLKQAFNAERNGIDFIEQELLEVSIVSVPANSEALGAGRDYSAAVRRWISGGAAAPSALPRDLTLEVVDDGELVLDVAPSRGVTRSSGDPIEVIGPTGRRLGPAEVEALITAQVDRLATRAVAEVLSETRARIARATVRR